jgi:hypothetical protein
MRQHIANAVLISLLFILAARSLAADSPVSVAGASEASASGVNEEPGEAIPEEFLEDTAQLDSNLAVDGEVFDEMVITGQRASVIRKLMNDFIIEIGEPASSSRGYARWRHPLCTGVYNLPQETAQYIADKMTIVALELGLRTGSPGCSPNLHIVFSPDARALATHLVDSSPLMFRPYGGAGGTTMGLGALEKFKTTEAPVRWWQITMVVDELGAPAIELPDCSINMEDGTCGITRIRGVASRLKAPIYDEIWASLIIVDVSKLDDVKWPQLMDYLAMVGLAQIDPDGQPTGYDSILNLFNAGSSPKVMSEMDRTYLQALYTMDLMTFPHAQRGILSSRMIRTLREMTE